jgi:hypothetical protein
MRAKLVAVAAVVIAVPAGDLHADEEEAPKARKDEKGAAEVESLSFAGRVFTRVTATSVDGAPWTGAVALDSARIAVNHIWKERVRTKVSIEAANGPEVKDAFVDIAASDCLSIRAGRFKVPISALEQASAWTLPTIDRGVVAKILEDGVALTGRRDGVQATWSPTLTTRLVASLAQSTSTDGTAPAQLLSEGAGVAAAVRLEHDVAAGVRVGVVGVNREILDGSTARRYWAGGADVEIDRAFGGRGLRVWADVLAGQSHLGTLIAGTERTKFVSAQGAVGFRFGGKKKNKRYIEPFALGGFFNPSIDKKGDDLSEIIAGVAAGKWKRWRGQGQLSVVTARGLQPSGIGGANVSIPDAISFTFQLGAAF